MAPTATPRQRRLAAVAVALVFLVLGIVLLLAGRDGGLLIAVIGGAAPLIMVFIWEQRGDG